MIYDTNNNLIIFIYSQLLILLLHSLYTYAIFFLFRSFYINNFIWKKKFEIIFRIAKKNQSDLVFFLFTCHIQVNWYYKKKIDLNKDISLMELFDLCFQ